MNSIVIGASQGLGLALTKKLLEEGHRVAAGVLERETPAAVAALHDQYGAQLAVFRADVTDEAEIASAAAFCGETFGQADALCNVAGVLLPGDRVQNIQTCDVRELRKTLDVNVVGAVIVAKSFYPIMKKGAMILTVTSEGGVSLLEGCGTWVPCYGLSKTAATRVVGLFNAAVSDVDFYGVHPGRMNTEMGKTTAQIEPEESAEGFYRLMSREVPLSRNAWYIDYRGKPFAAQSE